MYNVYIIQSLKNLSYYIGQTNDIEERLKRHNNGYEKFTKYLRPWELKYYKIFETRSEAIRFEKLLKSKKSRQYLEKLITEWNHSSIG